MYPQSAKLSPKPGADASTSATPSPTAPSAYNPPLRLLGRGRHIILPPTASTDVVAVVGVIVTAAAIIPPPAAAAPAGDVVAVVVGRGAAAVVVGALVEAAYGALRSRVVPWERGLVCVCVLCVCGSGYC